MKATQPLLKRISRQALNTKMTNKGYYKGTGTGSMGRHTKHGGYKIEWDKVRTYVVPKDLKEFKVNHQLQGIQVEILTSPAYSFRHQKHRSGQRAI